MKINICKKFPKIKKFEKKLSKSFPHASIKIKSCIGGMCGKCKSMPAVKVDGINISGKKIEEVIQKIETV